MKSVTPHEEEMLSEIRELQVRLSRAERSRLLWKFIAFLLVLGIGGLAWWHFFGG